MLENNLDSVAEESFYIQQQEEKQTNCKILKEVYTFLYWSAVEFCVQLTKELGKSMWFPI